MRALQKSLGRVLAFPILALLIAPLAAETIAIPAKTPGRAFDVAAAVRRAKPGDVLEVEGGWPPAGLKLVVLDIWPEVSTVTAGSPAAAAGIAPGDQLRALDGVETLGIGAVFLDLRLMPSQRRALGLRPDAATLTLRKAGGAETTVTLPLGAEAVPIADDVDRGWAAWDAGDQELAYDLWKPLAGAGDARAMSKLASYYDYRKSPSSRKALAWHKKAAAAGSILDMKTLASRTKDPAEAFQWRLKAAEAGDAEAMSAVGDAYREGTGAPADFAKALAWYRKGAEAGDMSSAGWLAYLYRSGDARLPSDEAQAQRWQCRSILRGGASNLSPTARYGEPGMMATDDPLAVACLRALALRPKSGPAKLRLAQAYLLGETGRRDAEEGRRWLEAAAAEQDPDGMNALGWALALGEGGPADPKRAFDLFTNVKQDDSPYPHTFAARNNLGWLYFYGEGVDKDESKALELFRLAGSGVSAADTSAGAAALYNVGVLSEFGLGGAPKSAEDAYEKYSEAAQDGDAWAQLKAGRALETGTAVAKDEPAAVAWYRKAAERGNAQAQFQMGRVYENGITVEKDPHEAAKWYARAAKAGAEAGLNAPGWPWTLRVAPGHAAGGAVEDLASLKEAAARKAAGPSAAPAAPAEEAVSSPVDEPRFRLPERPDDFALVVGVERYPRLPSARFAQRDAAAVRDHLLALGVPRRNLIYLTGEDASRAGIAKNLETWLPLNVKPDSRVYFYFSGHGAPDPEGGKAYLVPFDGDAEFLGDTAYPVSRLYEKLSALPAKQVVAFLDACFSGAGGRSVLARGTRPLVTRSDAGSVGAGKLVVLSAAEGGEISGTDEEQGHGLFTYYLLKGLDGAAEGGGAVTVGSLYRYLKPLVSDEARRENRSQTPQLLPPGSPLASAALRPR